MDKSAFDVATAMAPPTLQDFVEFNLAEVARHSAALATLEQEIKHADNALLAARNAAHAARGIYRARNRAAADKGTMPKDYTDAVREREAMVAAEKQRSMHQDNVQPVTATARQRRWRPGRPADIDNPDTEQRQVELPTPPMLPFSMALTNFAKRYEAPRQSFTGPTTTALLRIPTSVGVHTGSLLWVLYHFDRNAPGVAGALRARPPRLVAAAGEGRPGTFATRAPNRPTPLGLTLGCVVALRKVDGGVDRGGAYEVELDGVDILDETPVVAVRKYRSVDDCAPGEKAGWLDKVGGTKALYYDPDDQNQQLSHEDLPGVEPGGKFDLDGWSDSIQARLSYIDNRTQSDVFAIVRTTLTRDPLRAGRRFGAPVSDIEHRMLGLGSYRVVYQINLAHRRVRVTTICSGLRQDVLQSDYKSDIEVWEHRQFNVQFGTHTEQ